MKNGRTCERTHVRSAYGYESQDYKSGWDAV